MPSLTQIICLANSWKRQERCIAGIEPITGKWLRPVSQLPDGQVPKDMRLINRREPALLDILEIPLAETGDNFGFESENRSILPGKWRKAGQVPLEYVKKYCSKEQYILHNDRRYVTVQFLQSLPVEMRTTLQLVKAVEFSVKAVGQRFEGGEKWEGCLVTDTGKRLTTTITDPVFTRRLELGYRPQNSCLVTVSLSMPWRPPHWEGDDPCWKLIAAAIELPDEGNSSQIEIQEEDEEDLPF